MADQSDFLKSLRNELERRHGGHPDDLEAPFKGQVKGTYDLSSAEETVMELRAKVRTLLEQAVILKKMIGRQEETKAELQTEVDWLRGHLAEIQEKKAEAPSFVMKHLRFLIYACHPDRNPKRKESAEVTRELLALRRKT
jgi:chromosome segregation ATPase